nr:MAG: putative maturation protein [Leviviridae sp.]
MTTRIRSRNGIIFPPGSSFRYSAGTTQVGASVETFSEDCIDVADSYGLDHPFTLNREFLVYQTPLNGTALNPNGSPQTRFDNLIPTPFTRIVSHPATFPTAPSSSLVMTKVLSLTNPSRPVVDLPVFFKELKELPDLVRLAGKTLLKRGAGAYLTYEFGWKPLIGDLRKLVNFSDHFSKRERVIRSIFEGGGVKRRVDFSDHTVTSQRLLFEYSLGTSINAMEYTVSRRRIWGTTRWVPDSTRMPPRTDSEYRSLARRAVLGLDITPATLWEAMPWSWLADWFGSMGDYLGAHRNTVPAGHQNGNVMTQTDTYKTIVREPGLDVHSNTVKGGDMQRHRVSKLRVVQNNPTIAAFLPFLDKRQVSILGALSVLRGTRK